MKWRYIFSNWNRLSKASSRKGRVRRPSDVRVCALVWKFHFRYLYRRGFVLVKREPRSPRDELFAGPILEWKVPSMKKRQARTVEGQVKHLAPMESDMFHDHMALVEHCACLQYDDGTPRQAGWYTVKTQGSAWVLQVKDPDGECSFSAIGETKDKAFFNANLLLSCDEAPWEPDPFLAASNARKKKK